MTFAASEDTVCVINLVGFPPGSARGVKQTIKPIAEAAAFRRTVNYGLKNTAPAIAQKYATELTCEDMNIPCLDGIYVGAELVIDSVGELSYETATGTPHRPVVEGSSYTMGDATIYRPRLSVTVTDFQWDTDEMGAAVSWRLTCEET